MPKPLPKRPYHLMNLSVIRNEDGTVSFQFGHGGWVMTELESEGWTGRPTEYAEALVLAAAKNLERKHHAPERKLESHEHTGH